MNLVDEAKRSIPALDTILDEALNNLKFEKEEVKNNFGVALVSIDEEAPRIFRGYENKALLSLSKSWIESQREEIKNKLKKIVAQKGWNNFIREASELFAEFGTLVQSFEKDVGNMRKARGGKTFEKAILKLLKFIGISCEIPTGKSREKLRRIDIVIPSIEVAMQTPDRAVFLTCKRTLRERWKQER